MLAMVRAVEPKDEVEAMLAAQMAAVHMAALTMARRLNHVDNIAQQDSASNAFNKLARTSRTARTELGGPFSVPIDDPGNHCSIGP